ncbi:hypothetical protein ScPMuIL_017468 [Solemya velum]
MAAPDRPNERQVMSRGKLSLKLEAGQSNPGSPTLASMGHKTQIERLRLQGLASAGKLQISPDKTYDFTADDLKHILEIGRGNYGTVDKMIHERSGKIMAVKRIRSTVDEREQKQLLMDLDVVMRSNDCPYIVQFYGALFKEGDCWICMELMDISLDKFYKHIYGVLLTTIPEDILGKITVAILQSVLYLHYHVWNRGLALAATSGCKIDKQPMKNSFKRDAFIAGSMSGTGSV